MFFTLSKLMVVLLYPFNWIWVLLLVGFFVRRPALKRAVTIAAIVLVFVFGNEVLFDAAEKSWQPRPVQLPANARYSAGIVLGGYETFDRHGNGYFNHAADRFIATLRLYKMGNIQNVVVSGARVKNGQVIPNQFIEQQFKLMGVPTANLLPETQSKNTFENALRTKKLLDSAGLQAPYLLITSAEHMPRALKVFKNAGVWVRPYPSAYLVVDRGYAWHDFIFPKAFVLNQWNDLLKEVVGLWVYQASGRA